MKFLASRELGRLAKWLRILGFDTAYFRQDNKSSFIITALRENRIVLTRNKLILKDKSLNSLFINSEILPEQITQVLEHFHIKLKDCPVFSRCVVCNEALCKIAKDQALSRVPEYIYKTQEEFYQCPNCQRIYWRGSHWGNVEEVMTKIYRQVKAEKSRE